MSIGVRCRYFTFRVPVTNVICGAVPVCPDVQTLGVVTSTAIANGNCVRVKILDCRGARLSRGTLNSHMAAMRLGDVFGDGHRLGTGAWRLLLVAMMFLGERVEQERRRPTGSFFQHPVPLLMVCPFPSQEIVVGLG